MPHVKGNKFKPKEEAVKPPQQEVKATVVSPTAMPTSNEDTTKKNKDRKRNSKHLRQDTQEPRTQARHQHIITHLSPPTKGGTPVGSNWEALKSSLQPPPHSGGGGNNNIKQTKRKKYDGKSNVAPPLDSGKKPTKQGAPPPSSSGSAKLTRVLALDCEMVGAGEDGTRSLLARVCVVNSCGEVLLDTHVQPKEKITDYRTRFSGVRPSDLKGAPSFSLVQSKVMDMMRGRILVGHGLKNDLHVLGIHHPKNDVRDTAKYPPLMVPKHNSTLHKSQSLKSLAMDHLGLDIQNGEHHPAEDARAALNLYLKHKVKWEKKLLHGRGVKVYSSEKKKKSTVTVKERRGVETMAELARMDHLVDY
jgi:RNA exonuclease 4